MKWLVPLVLCVIVAGTLIFSAPRPEPPPVASLDALFTQHEKNVIAQFSISQATLEQAVEKLNSHAANFGSAPLRFTVWREGDSVPEGLTPLPCDLSKDERHKQTNEITVELTNVPLTEATRYVASLADLKYHPVNDTVWLYSPKAFKETGVIAEYYLTGEIRLEALGDVDTSVEHIDLKPFLISNGVSFAPGDVAYYDRKEQRVHLESNQENHDLFGTAFGICGGPWYFESRWERFTYPWRLQWYLLWEKLSPPPTPSPIPTLTGSTPTDLSEPAIPGLSVP